MLRNDEAKVIFGQHGGTFPTMSHSDQLRIKYEITHKISSSGKQHSVFEFTFGEFQIISSAVDSKRRVFSSCLNLIFIFSVCVCCFSIFEDCVDDCYIYDTFSRSGPLMSISNVRINDIEHIHHIWGFKVQSI